MGEWATSSFGVGRRAEIELLAEVDFPDSLGLLYSTFTYFCGFKVNSGEYKLMSLAPYGEPRYLKTTKDNIATINSDGSVILNTDHFGFLDRQEMSKPSFSKIFGGPRPKNIGLDALQKRRFFAAVVALLLQRATRFGELKKRE